MATALSAFQPCIAPEVPGCPEPLIDDAVRRACIEFCERAEILREQFTAATAVGSDTATMAPVGGEVAKINTVEIDGNPLDRSRRADFGITDATDTGEPSEFYFEEPDTLRFDKAADAIYTVDVEAVIKPSRDAASVADVLFDRYRDAIAQGAKAFLMSMVNVPWTNGDGAILNAGLFTDAADKARYRKATGGNGNPLRSRGHYF